MFGSGARIKCKQVPTRRDFQFMRYYGDGQAKAHARSGKVHASYQEAVRIIAIPSTTRKPRFVSWSAG